MTIVFLGLLALAWIAVFLPAALRARQSAPLTTAERFKRRMSLIAPRAAGSGRWIVVPESYDRLTRSSFRRGQQRRTRILVGLVVGAATSGFVALFTGGGMWEVHLAVDASLALYIALLLEAKRRRAEQLTKLRSIEGRRGTRAPAVTFNEPVRAGGGQQH